MEAVWLVLVAIIALVGWLFVGILIQPFWALASCIGSDRSTAIKVIWVIAMVCTWPLGAWAYGLFAAARPALRWCTGAVLVVGVGGLLLVFLATPWLAAGARKELGELGREVEQASLHTLMDAERQRMRESIHMLREPAGGRWFRELDREEGVIAFADLLKDILRDRQVTREEYQDWMVKFQHRAGLDSQMITGVR